MKGQILNVYPEGREQYKGCVLHIEDNVWGDEQGVHIVDLDNGEIKVEHHGSCEAPIIDDIFNWYCPHCENDGE